MVDSSASEVLSLIVPFILLVFICTTLTTIFYSKFENTLWRYVCDFCIVAVPQIFITTVLVPYINEVIAFIIFICTSITILAYLNRKESKFKYVPNDEKKHFITNFRSMINLSTAVAILAVDFKIFPPQFQKQLQYGYSVMDIGVGLFIYANAIVAPEIKTQSHSLKKSIIDTVPLIVLGIGRYIATTLINYNVSVTEYGLHWNFFITLAFTRIISSIFLTYLPFKFSFVYGLVIVACHEILLQCGLADYVFSDAVRDNIFSSNREGIISTLGFIGLYFLTVAIGIWMNLKEKSLTSKLSLCIKFTIATVTLFSISVILENRFGLSRRLANSAYCTWILFVSVFMTFLFYIMEIFQKYLYARCSFRNCIFTPFLMDAISYNGLIYFLLANILTGLVNISCDTSLVNPINSLLILIIYMNVVSIVISILYVKGINLKSIVTYFKNLKKKYK